MNDLKRQLEMIAECLPPSRFRDTVVDVTSAENSEIESLRAQLQFALAQGTRKEGMEEETVTAVLEALGHIKVENGRCAARYRDAPHVVDGPRNLPVWCDLPAGHEGPHRHVTGHRSFVMDRESLIEMRPLPDICQKCGTRWPCKDAEAITAAIRAAAPPSAGEECCEWVPLDKSRFDTGCGYVYELYASNVIDHKGLPCAFCQKKVKIKE